MILSHKIKPERVQAATVEIGLAAKDVAEILGCHIVVYYGKLNGKRNWTLDNLIRLKEVTGKSFDYFFGINSKDE